jgi:hypothetical protein
MVDVVINLAAASYKRKRHLDDYQNLKDALLSIKPYWIITKPKDTHQWTILLGTNWDAFPQLKKDGFVRFESDLGREWFDKVVYTQQERHDKLNPSLFDFDSPAEE